MHGLDKPIRSLIMTAKCIHRAFHQSRLIDLALSPNKPASGNVCFHDEMAVSNTVQRKEIKNFSGMWFKLSRLCIFFFICTVQIGNANKIVLLAVEVKS